MEMAEYVSNMYGNKMENIKEEMDSLKQIYENLPIEESLNEQPKETIPTKIVKVFTPTAIHNEVPDEVE